MIATYSNLSHTNSTTYLFRSSGYTLRLATYGDYGLLRFSLSNFIYITAYIGNPFNLFDIITKITLIIEVQFYFFEW